MSVYSQKDKFPYFFARIEDTDTIMKNWEYPFLITSGVTIDIFPVIGLPDKRKEALEFCDKIRGLGSKLIERYIVNFQVDEYEVKTRMEIIEQICNMMEVYEYDRAENMGYILGKNGEKDIVERQVYSSAIEMEFEGRKFWGFKEYHIYLAMYYGDYMQLPPVENRKPHLKVSKLKLIDVEI